MPFDAVIASGRGASAIAWALALCALPLAPGPVAARPHQEDEVVEIEDEPVFPGLLMRDAVRVWLESRFVPGAGLDADDAEISLYKPTVRARVRVPMGGRASSQLTASFSTSRYDVDGESSLFSDCDDCRPPDEFYAVSLGAQAGLLLNPDGHLLFDRERWALLAGAFGRARWESGAFDESLTAGGAFGIGYQLPRRLRAPSLRSSSSLPRSTPAARPTRWSSGSPPEATKRTCRHLAPVRHRCSASASATIKRVARPSRSPHGSRRKVSSSPGSPPDSQKSVRFRAGCL